MVEAAMCSRGTAVATTASRSGASPIRQRRTEIDRGGGFADTTLLVRQRQDARMARRGRRSILLINFINCGHA